MDFLRESLIEVLVLVVFATAHGYAGAWLAVRMLFRPRKPLKVFGLTIFYSFMLAFILPSLVIHQMGAIGMVGGDPSIAKPSWINPWLNVMR